MRDQDQRAWTSGGRIIRNAAQERERDGQATRKPGGQPVSIPAGDPQPTVTLVHPDGRVVNNASPKLAQALKYDGFTVQGEAPKAAKPPTKAQAKAQAAIEAITDAQDAQDVPAADDAPED